MQIEKRILTKNPCFQAGKKIKVAGLMLHSVGCPQPSAEKFVTNWNKPDSGRACVHAFIDGFTGTVYQTLPWDHRAWHCGGSGNNTHIGVEMCEPACLKYTGGSGFTCSNVPEALEVVRRTYAAAVELFAFLCGDYELDPLADGVIISHKEGHDRGLASGHGDPEHLWNQLQTGYTMDGFRRAVSAAMKGTPMPAQMPVMPPPPAPVPMPVIPPPSAPAPMPVMPPPSAPAPMPVMPPPSVPAPMPVMPPPSAPAPMPVMPPPSVPAPPPVMPSPSVPAPPPEFTPPPAPALGMKASDKCVELVAKFEGCRLAAYKCPAGVWTIGYGHTAGVKQGDVLKSEEEARAMLSADLEKYAGYVNGCVQKGIISFPLNQNQFDALTSFAYNCGNGNLQKLVSGRDAATVADKFLLYDKGGGRALPGLTRRRREERALFLGQEGI